VGGTLDGRRAPVGKRARYRLGRGVLAVALVGLLASCLPPGATEVPYRMDASNQAGWWHPMDAHGGNLFLAYNAWGGSNQGGATDTHTVYVARRSPSGAWVRGCLRTASGACAVFPDDIGHNQPTVAVDGDGYIHVFASMHANNWRYFRSSRPGDPTSMVNRSATMPDQGGRYTYPNATRTPNGDVYLIIRHLSVGRLYRWNDGANTWSRVATFASDPNYVAYPDDVVSDQAGNIHIAWEWAYGGADGLRHLGSYLRYQPATGGFFNAASAPVAVPARTGSPVVYQPVEPGEDPTDQGSAENPPGLQSAKLVINPATGRPLVGYRFRATAGGRFQVRLAEWTGAAWQRQIVYAGRYTTYAAIDVTLQGGAPRVYYAKTAVPNGDQAFASVRQPDGRWVEDPPLLPGIRVERLSVIEVGSVDHLYLAAPSARRLYHRAITLT
jgi:BNR repeat-containing family member